MISAVVVTHESAFCIGKCVSSLRQHLPKAEIVVVDNASSDASAQIALASGAHVVELPRNAGFGRACNAGVSAASGEHLLFVNPDVTLVSVGEKALEELLANRPFGLVPGRLVDTDGAVRRERRLPEPPLLADFLRHTVGLLRPRRLRLPMRLTRDDPAGWASAALLLAARDEFERIGGFDPRFFLYYEDRDLFARYRTERYPFTRPMQSSELISAADRLRAIRCVPNSLDGLSYPGSNTWPSTAISACASISPPAGRIARKRLQVESLMAFLRQQALAHDDICPEARNALANATG